jgi:hypothetical protein
MFGWLFGLAKAAVGAVGKAVSAAVGAVGEAVTAVVSFGAKVIETAWKAAKTVAGVIYKCMEWVEGKVREWWQKLPPEVRETLLRLAPERLKKYVFRGWKVAKKLVKRVSELPEEDQQAIYAYLYRKIIQELTPQLETMVKKDLISDFDEHLRLRACSKFLRDMTQRLEKKTVDTADLRLIELIDGLARRQALSDEDLDDLDYLVRMKYGGRSALALAVEQLLSTWVEEQLQTEEEWKGLTDELRAKRLDLAELELKKEVEGATPEEEKKILELKADMLRLEEKIKRCEQRLDNLRIVIGAGEGILEVFEEVETDPAMKRHAENVARILLAYDRGQELTPRARELLEYFAYVYMPEARKRSKKLLAELSVASSQ